MEIFSAGTSGTTAEKFFQRLKSASVSHVVDTRLHASSQLAAFAKSRDLRFFLSEILSVGYSHELLLAPEEEALKSYRAGNMTWQAYEARYLDLLERRDVARNVDSSKWGDQPLLLCSEPTPEKCHRRLAATYLRDAWGAEVVAKVTHL